MERVWTFVWAIELRAFPIQAISREAGGNVERIAFVGPPAIEAHGEILAMSVPVAACLGLVELRDFAGIAHGAAQLVRENDNVDDGAEIIFVEGPGWFRRSREKFCGSAGEIKRSERLVHEHRPARCTHQPRNGDTPTVCVQAIASLAADHRVEHSTTVELLAAFTQRQKRRISGGKRDRTDSFVDGELLNRAGFCRGNGERQRRQGNCNCEVSALYDRRRQLISAKGCDWWTEGRLDQRAVKRNLAWPA